MLKNIRYQMGCCHQLQTFNQTTNRDESDHHSKQPLNYNTLLVGLHLATFHPCQLLKHWQKNTQKKKKHPKKHPLLGHLNATTFSQFLKTICAPGHRCITWNARRVTSFSGWISATEIVCREQDDARCFFRNLHIYIYIISYIEISIQVVEAQKKIWRLRSPCLGTHPQPKYKISQ